MKFSITPELPEFLAFDKNLGVIAGRIPENFLSMKNSEMGMGEGYDTMNLGMSKHFSKTYTVTAESSTNNWARAERKFELQIRAKNGPEVLSFDHLKSSK